MEDWGIFSIESLRRILRIPLRLRCSYQCGGSMTSNDSSRRPPVVVGGGGEVWECWGGFRGREGGERTVLCC